MNPIQQFGGKAGGNVQRGVPRFKNTLRSAGILPAFTLERRHLAGQTLRMPQTSARMPRYVDWQAPSAKKKWAKTVFSSPAQRKSPHFVDPSQNGARRNSLSYSPV
ncbi:MAG: hypothetical protein ACKN9T_11500 [Candidatus Methylumidiphilus sp.]